MLDKQKLLYDLFNCYYEARKNKRNTLNQLDFEFNLEKNLIKLYEELLKWNYRVWKSIYFIQTHPVKREIFAWSFRDRIIHHLICNYISPFFEKEFIYDSYSCRKFKGTSLWVKRAQKFIRSCSDNYKKDCYILKLDISWYFMSMNKDILFHKIELVLKNNIKNLIWIDYKFIINLIKEVIFNDCTKNSIFKWKSQDYIWLPKNKSLFFASKWCGLPIWNLTSQLFSNIYFLDFDKYIKNDLWIKYYWRYVDDFFIVHKNKNYLAKLVLEISNYLENNLKLKLHPKKIYLQHYSKWILFLGVFIKPYRTYIRKRTIWYFYSKIVNLNKKLKQNNYKINFKLQSDFLSCVNSYLGMIKNHKSYKKRKNLVLNIVSTYFWDYFYLNNNYTKVSIKLN